MSISLRRPYSSVSWIFPAFVSGLLLAASFVAAPEAEGAEEIVSSCEDGSFTNRADVRCLPYRSLGAVTVLPDDRTAAVVRDRAKSDTRTMTAVLPPPSGKISKTGYTLCGLYEEWQALRRTTSSGTVFLRGRDVARWQALSKIFLSVGTPQCEVLPVVRAAQASR